MVEALFGPFPPASFEALERPRTVDAGDPHGIMDSEQQANVQQLNRAFLLLNLS